MPEKVYILPAFSLNWPIAWDRIRNGERVVTETICRPDKNTNDFYLQSWESRDTPQKVVGINTIYRCLGHKSSGAAVLNLRE